MSVGAIVAIAMFGFVVAMIFGIPLVAIWTYHKRKLEEIRGRNQSRVAEETRAAIEALRQEFAALRDTTTQYDMSFDTALHRLENRIGHMEQRINAVESGPEHKAIEPVQLQGLKG